VRDGVKWCICLVMLVLMGCAGDAPYRVARVIDGDTFVVEGPDEVRVRIRLRRVNAPELDEPGGPEAKAALEERILGKRIHLKSYAIDKYGRTIAEIMGLEGSSKGGP